jgi:ketosteroid isomerase-like protein
MSQDNVEIVRSLYEAGGDRERLLALADPDIVVDATRRVFNPTTHVGTDGLRRMFAEADEIWDQFLVEPLELIDAGDRVVVTVRVVGKGKGSGAEVRQHSAQIWTLREGRVIRWEVGYADRTEALEFVGLLDQDAPTD